MFFLRAKTLYTSLVIAADCALGVVVGKIVRVTSTRTIARVIRAGEGTINPSSSTDRFAVPYEGMNVLRPRKCTRQQQSEEKSEND